MTTKILHIDTDLQVPNRIHKNDTNQVSQITDKAQNIAFTQSDTAKMPTFSYDGYYEFDGADDIVMGSRTPFDYSKPFSFYIEFNSVDLTARNQNIIGIRELASPNEFISLYRYNSNVKFAVYLNAAYVFNFDLNTLYNGDYKIFVTVSNDQVTVYNNKVLISNKKAFDLSASPLLNFGIPLNFGNDLVGRSNSFFNGRIFTFKAWDTDFPEYQLYESDLLTKRYDMGDTVDISTQITSNFNYHHRYKDGEFYLSSKYLKDAVIDVNNKIERIYNSIKDSFFSQAVLANRPTLTNAGIKYALGNYLLQQTSVEYTYNTGDFFLGRWVDFQRLSTVFIIGSNVIKIGIDATNIFTETSGGKLYANKTHNINEGLKYVGFHRENGVIFLSVNGYFENSRTEAIDYNTDENAQIGGDFAGVDTDMYNTKQKVITFNGKTQTNKVFEPPHRGGFNSDIKQY